MDSQARLAGKHVLVVEDKYMLAHDLKLLLEGHGAHVVGPYASSAAAMEALRSHACVYAVLDIALTGGAVYPLAAELRRRGAPFVFRTGFSSTDIRPDFADTVCLEKPFEDARVVDAICKLVGG